MRNLYIDSCGKILAERYNGKDDEGEEEEEEEDTLLGKELMEVKMFSSVDR